MSNDSEFPPAASLPGGASPDNSDAAPQTASDAAPHLSPDSASPGDASMNGSPSGGASEDGSFAPESWVRPNLDSAALLIPEHIPQPSSHLQQSFPQSLENAPPGELSGLPPTGFFGSPGQTTGPPAQAPIRHIPNLGHTLLLLILAAVVLFVTEIAVFSAAMGMHLFGSESPQQLLREPRLLIPCMAISYLVIVAIAWPLFSNLWREPFPRGVRWNGGTVLRRSYLFLGIGIALSIGVQLLSNFLPIPRTLPIDNFFRTPADLWLVASFGTILAPACEELAFRGFLLPSLASAWDWAVQGRGRGGSGRGGLGRDLSEWARAMRPRRPELPAGYRADGRPGPLPELLPGPQRGPLPEPQRKPLPDPRWSAGALVFSSILTSIGFALLHADQLGHSLAPLAVLFAVSLVLCAVRLKFHSLAASALVHAAYNGTIFALIFYATDGFRHLDKLAR